MPGDYDPLFCPRPYWFASSELLTKVFRAEINMVNQLLAKHPSLSSLLDAPEATVPERTACFTLLAHAKLIEIVDQTFVERYEQSPSLDEAESSTLRRTYNLVATDAPAWVQEMVQVVERIPAHICTLLPEPLREQRFDNDNPDKIRAIDSARKTLGNVEQIQTLTGRVLDEQLQRLERRWAAAQAKTNPSSDIALQASAKTKIRSRTRDKQRVARDKLIAQIDDVAPTIMEFVKLMDERRVAHQPMWSGWPGSWVEAYKNPRLRRLIQQDKSRALVRVRIGSQKIKK